MLEVQNRKTGQACFFDCIQDSAKKMDINIKFLIFKIAAPKIHDFQKIFVYGGIKSLENLPQNDWLELREIRILNNSFAYRLLWQQYHLGKLVEQDKALLFVPGGLYLGSHRPFVSMFQNMQIFETAEKNREGFSRE